MPRENLCMHGENMHTRTEARAPTTSPPCSPPVGELAIYSENPSQCLLVKGFMLTLFIDVFIFRNLFLCKADDVPGVCRLLDMPVNDDFFIKALKRDCDINIPL